MSLSQPGDDVLVEIVCQTPADARATREGGAHRIELCAALAVGGLTPTVGLLQAVREAAPGLAIMAMVRPRPGGFCYEDAELAVMERDADLLLEAGADGIVFGILDAGGVNMAACRRLVERARAAGRQTVFHRAFDVTPDPYAALDALIDLGVTRVLTSGRQRTALEGAPLLRELRERAAGRIEILAGGGVRPNNVREIVQATGCNQVHLAPLRPMTDPTSSRGPVDYGGYNGVDGEAVGATVRALQDAFPGGDGPPE